MNSVGESSSTTRATIRAKQSLGGIYHIINVLTGTYAALLDDKDRSEVVNIRFNLKDDINQGSKWLINHLGRDEYKIHNIDFDSFAGYDTGPQVEDQILSKSSAASWIIRLVQSPNIFTVSPTENPDVFWMCLSKAHGTPASPSFGNRLDILELGQPDTAKRCRWEFRPVGSNADPQPVANDAPSLVDLNSLLEKLPTVPHARYEADPRPKCLPGTRVELLQNIRTWITDPASRPIFWLRGQAGTGKTTISLTVADDCERHKQLGASFLFSRDHDDRSELRHVFPTIARQLSGLHQQYAIFLAEVLAKEDGVEMFQPDVQLERLIVKPLQKCEDFPSPTVIVIDALDECKDNSPVSTLLDILHQHLHRIPMLKLFVTSRPEPHITVIFTGELRRETTLVTLHDIQTTTVDKDITLVIRTFLSKAARIYPDLAAENWPLESDVLVLTKRSARLFIYAVTAIRFIIDPEFDDPRGRLNDVLKLSGHASTQVFTLDQLYLDILTAACPVQWPLENKTRLREILGAILIIATPLPPETLESLLGLGRGRVRTTLRRLHSVLVIPDVDKARIRIIHPSFFDFLTARCVDARFRIDQQSHHEQLARCCFEQMCRGLKRNICQLDDPSKLNKDIADLNDRVERFIPMSLQYACIYWSTHLSRSGQGDDLIKHLDKFLSRQLLHWIEVMRFTRLVHQATRQLSIAKSFVLPKHAHTLTLLEEGHQFLRIFHRAISQSTVHVYVSALGLFKPHTFRRTYERELERSLPNFLRPVITPRARSTAGIRTEGSLPCLAGGLAIVHSSFSRYILGFLETSTSSDGTHVASWTGDETIQIWSTASETLIATLKPSSTPIWAHFLPGNARIACVSNTHMLTVWEVGESRVVESVSLEPSSPENPWSSVRYAADADFRILGRLSNERYIQFWDPQTWQLQYPLPGRWIA